MKKLIAMLLVLVMCLSLCACGQSNAAKECENLIQENTNLSATVEQEETSSTIVQTIPETTESIVYAESIFSVEDIAYEYVIKNTPEFRIKIRNTTTEKVSSFFFTVQLLDKNGDVIDSKDPMGIDTLDAGQAFWLETRWLDHNTYSTIQEYGEVIESIRIVSATIKNTGTGSPQWLKYEFENPPTYKVAEIKEKAM